MANDNERTELSRITFVFETRCTADCKLYFLAVRENTFVTQMPEEVGYNIFKNKIKV